MEVNYVIQKSRRRSMSIHVADDKKVIVKVPLGTPTFIAENFIKEKKDCKDVRSIRRAFLSHQDTSQHGVVPSIPGTSSAAF